MPHGPDSITGAYVEYLVKSQKYSDDLARRQALGDQFIGADTGVGVPEMQPSLLSKGAPGRGTPWRGRYTSAH